VKTPPPWTLTLGEHPPVPVTLDRVDGSTTHYLTSVTLPLNPPGTGTSVRAMLTAPDGSQQTGVASIDGVVWYRRASATKVSFTPFASDIHEPLT
jgi:hypothetical protein